MNKFIHAVTSLEITEVKLLICFPDKANFALRTY